MAQDITLKLTKIDGESKKKGFENQIDVYDFKFGVSQSASSSEGLGGGSAKSDCKDLIVTKLIDKATPILFLHSALGTPIPEAVLTVRKAGGQALDYLVVTLKDVIVTNVATGGKSEDERVREEISLSYAKITIQYKAQNADGTAGATIVKAYDLESNIEV
jgi:type VI secretion system secreted protein Hcp